MSDEKKSGVRVVAEIMLELGMFPDDAVEELKLALLSVPMVKTSPVRL